MHQGRMLPVGNVEHTLSGDLLQGSPIFTQLLLTMIQEVDATLLPDEKFLSQITQEMSAVIQPAEEAKLISPDHRLLASYPNT